MKRNPKDLNAVLKPSAAGRFYSADAIELSAEVNRFISEADVEPSGERVLTVLSPHAGYVFSGPVAGYSFRHVQTQKPDTVLAIGLSHRGVEGGCVFPGRRFETPLGAIEADVDLSNALIEEGDPIHAAVEPFRSEHSVEVNLPFIQTVFPKAQVTAMLVSDIDPGLCRDLGRLVAGVLRQASDKSILIVVSTDMSHYPAYETANRVDREMLASLETMEPEKIYACLQSHVNHPEPNLHCVMCGGGATLTAVEAVLALGAKRAKTLHYRNSGDSAYGEHDRVVGYGSLAIYAD